MRTIKRDIVGAFIFSADGKLLLGKSTRATYEGMWIVPGGGIEQGETKKDTLIREVFEETGLRIADETIQPMDIRLSGTSEKILKDTGERVIGEYEFYNFIVRLKSNASDTQVESADDFSEATWWDVRELLRIPLSPPTKSSLEFMGLLA